MVKKYPKAFEDWYRRHTGVQCLRSFQYGEYQQALYNAWKAGRKHQKRLAYSYGEVVRWA